MKYLAAAYIEYLLGLKQIKKPKMPTFNVDAYNDNEYVNATTEILEDFDNCSDIDMLIEYEKFLKGE